MNILIIHDDSQVYVICIMIRRIPLPSHCHARPRPELRPEARGHSLPYSLSHCSSKYVGPDSPGPYLSNHRCKGAYFFPSFSAAFCKYFCPGASSHNRGGSKKHKGSKNRRISYWLMVNYRGRPSLSDRLPVIRKTLSPARGFLQRICISLHVTVFEISDICLWNLIFLEYFTLRIQIKSEFILLQAKT